MQITSSYRVSIIPYIIILLLSFFPRFVVSQNPCDSVFVDRIILFGNNQTKDFVIYEDLLLKEGEYYPQNEIENLRAQSVNELRRSGFYNLVEISIINNEGIECSKTVFVRVTEKWAIVPIPLLRFADQDINNWWGEKDFSQLSYGLELQHRNFRGQKELLSIYFIAGFDLGAGIKYKNPALLRNRKWGLDIRIDWNQRNMIPVENSFDQIIYDEGERHPSFRDFEIETRLHYRSSDKIQHSVLLAYSGLWLDSFLDNKYNILNTKDGEMHYLSTGYSLQFDTRDSEFYPLDGEYLKLDIIQRGLGLLGQQNEHMYLHLKSALFHEITKNVYAGIGALMMYGDKKDLPFYYRYALGYEQDFVRGYEEWIIESDSYYLLKSNLRSKLWAYTDRKVNSRFEQDRVESLMEVWLSCFVDSGLAYDSRHNEYDTGYANSILLGYGLGIDILGVQGQLIRMEYSINKDYEHGFRLHLRAPL